MYAELHCLSNFSFLRGASQPEELVAQAKILNYRALALTDECSLAGVVRAHLAAKELELPLIIGSELNCIDELKIVALATDRGELWRSLPFDQQSTPRFSQRQLCSAHGDLEVPSLDAWFSGCRADKAAFQRQEEDGRWLRERFRTLMGWRGTSDRRPRCTAWNCSRRWAWCSDCHA